MFISNNPYFALQKVCSSQITPILLYKMPNQLICLLLTIIYWYFQIVSQGFISMDLVFVISTLSVVSIAFYTSQYTKWWLWETLELAVPHHHWAVWHCTIQSVRNLSSAHSAIQKQPKTANWRQPREVNSQGYTLLVPLKHSNRWVAMQPRGCHALFSALPYTLAECTTEAATTTRKYIVLRACSAPQLKEKAPVCLGYCPLNRAWWFSGGKAVWVNQIRIVQNEPLM